ncbi:hypothetical protein Plim_0942 [Planctopirus limnophila DSM 3776]|uniref:Uncharacterized protein n=1 Tax=Planctopirus limnophila (strain ATCC 43296 / DSM 3776 / IFAM 1008 / Mu 290) TaxID=521674 RepID=D5ST18_PLAL2|nr:hypothetical protein Plim_0942 [Planctopirus limnophila DSM 3776]
MPVVTQTCKATFGPPCQELFDCSPESLGKRRERASLPIGDKESDRWWCAEDGPHSGPYSLIFTDHAADESCSVWA